MPTAGEDRLESVYRNPVGAQSGMPLEGQQSGETDLGENSASAGNAAEAKGHTFLKSFRHG